MNDEAKPYTLEDCTRALLIDALHEPDSVVARLKATVEERDDFAQGCLNWERECEVVRRQRDEAHAATIVLVERLASAREEQREACAKSVVAIGPAPLRGTYDNGVDDSADAVRATPLTATPLADRIRVLEAACAAECVKAESAESAHNTLARGNARLREAVMEYLAAGDRIDWPTRVPTLRQAMCDAALATDGGTWLREFARRVVTTTRGWRHEAPVEEIVAEVCK
jgi:hypothetical protein